MNEIYIRLKQIVDYKGFKSVNEFALKGLNYSSAEKLNRLKKENTTPGWEILHDIANKFVDINLNWFVTGAGEMSLTGNVSEPTATYSIENKSEVVQAKNEIIDILKKENIELRTDKEFFRDLLKSKLL